MQELYIPRKKYIQTKAEIGNCPDCQKPLVKEVCVVLLYGKSEIDEAEFMSNAAGSHFCHNCPVVVFEKETVEKALTLGLKANKSFNYAILGLVDLDAVPEEKRHLELGAEDNPIPIVHFLSTPASKTKTRKRRKSRSPISHKPRVAKNAACPCGSGKKYKRCCM